MMYIYRLFTASTINAVTKDIQIHGCGDLINAVLPEYMFVVTTLGTDIHTHVLDEAQHRDLYLTEHLCPLPGI